MKISDALEFQHLYQRLKNEAISIRLAYKLNKLNNKVLSEASFYEDSLHKILNQYAEKDEYGNFIQNEDNTGILIQKECLEICHRKINELQSIEIDIFDISFTLDELEELKITPAELVCLESLIKE